MDNNKTPDAKDETQYEKGFLAGIEAERAVSVRLADLGTSQPQAVAEPIENGVWLVKDFADGWIAFTDVSKALHEAQMTGSVMKFQNNQVATPPAKDTTSEKVEELLAAWEDIKELLDVDDGESADNESIGWKGDEEMTETFGQVRRFNRALSALSRGKD